MKTTTQIKLSTAQLNLIATIDRKSKAGEPTNWYYIKKAGDTKISVDVLVEKGVLVKDELYNHIITPAGRLIILDALRLALGRVFKSYTVNLPEVGEAVSLVACGTRVGTREIAITLDMISEHESNIHYYLCGIFANMVADAQKTITEATAAVVEPVVAHVVEAAAVVTPNTTEQMPYEVESITCMECGYDYRKGVTLCCCKGSSNARIAYDAARAKEEYASRAKNPITSTELVRHQAQFANGASWGVWASGDGQLATDDLDEQQAASEHYVAAAQGYHVDDEADYIKPEAVEGCSGTWPYHHGADEKCEKCRPVPASAKISNGEVFIGSWVKILPPYMMDTRSRSGNDATANQPGIVRGICPDGDLWVEVHGVDWYVAASRCELPPSATPEVTTRSSERACLPTINTEVATTPVQVPPVSKEAVSFGTAHSQFKFEKQQMVDVVLCPVEFGDLVGYTGVILERRMRKYEQVVYRLGESLKHDGLSLGTYKWEPEYAVQIMDNSKNELRIIRFEECDLKPAVYTSTRMCPCCKSLVEWVCILQCTKCQLMCCTECSVNLFGKVHCTATCWTGQNVWSTPEKPAHLCCYGACMAPVWHDALCRLCGKRTCSIHCVDFQLSESGIASVHCLDCGYNKLNN